jgi:hypothetical protein
MCHSHHELNLQERRSANQVKIFFAKIKILPIEIAFKVFKLFSRWNRITGICEPISKEKVTMELKALKAIPSWNWPKGVDAIIRDALLDNSADVSERCLAAEMAGDYY